MLVIVRFCLFSFVCFVLRVFIYDFMLNYTCIYIYIYINIKKKKIYIYIYIYIYIWFCFIMFLLFVFFLLLAHHFPIARGYPKFLLFYVVLLFLLDNQLSRWKQKRILMILRKQQIYHLYIADANDAINFAWFWIFWSLGRRNRRKHCAISIL